MKGVAAGEVLLVLCVLGLAYLLYLQQEQIVSLEVEIDRLTGATRDLAATVAGARAVGGAAKKRTAAKPKPDPDA